MAQVEPLPLGAAPALRVEPAGRIWRAVGRRARAIAALALLIGLSVWLALWELRSSTLQASLFAYLARGAGFELAPGAAPQLSAPAGPSDRRLGYAELPAHVARLESQGFQIVAGARPTPSLERMARLGLFPPYAEKAQAGLRVSGRDGRTLFESLQPAHVYPDFDEVPPLVVATLLFIENRELLDDAAPRRNPAVEWDRLGKAVWLGLSGAAGPGGSTLATQMEKFRHSPDGITRSPLEKLQQMLSASLRSYRTGPRTLETRRQIVVDYLNSIPLSATPQTGEVLGLGDGLAAWYGADPEEVSRLLSAGAGAPSAAVGEAYARVLSLLLSARRPSELLRGRPEPLRRQTRRHLGLLAGAGVIPEALRDAALEASAALRPGLAPNPDPDGARARRLAAPVRARLAALLGTHGFYPLDQLDLGVESSLDTRAQQRLDEALERLRDPRAARAAGLVGPRLLGPDGQEDVAFSLVVYERGEDGHRLRAQVGNLDALDLNDGVRLDFGSTAKLRTLISYLETVAGIRERYLALPAAERGAFALPTSDALGQWGLAQLRARPEPSLAALLEAALERRYSASPAAGFYTGGALHHFRNFDPDDDARRVSVREAFQHSINLAFVRVLRDVVNHIVYSELDAESVLAAAVDDPRRREYLLRFAEREGAEYLTRAHQRLAGLAVEDAVARLYAGRRPSPRAAGVALRAIDPAAPIERFAERLAALLPSARLAPGTLAAIYHQSDPARFSLQDLGYLARLHPLEFWLLRELRERSQATLEELLEASAGARAEAYRWLFRSSARRAQDLRIRSVLERDAFARIHARWRATGYPFGSLVPSLATALGSSADRPLALAELMGILANDGWRLPLRRIESLRFAADTPYDTLLAPAPTRPEPVLRPEVCAAVRGALVATVEGGTARRARGALLRSDGSPAVVGGKTGTGDHRFKIMRGERVVEERPVSRSAAFAFLIDDRFFGVVTAVVMGAESGRHGFTSSLPVQLFRELLPGVLPGLEAGAAQSRISPAPMLSWSSRSSGT